MTMKLATKVYENVQKEQASNNEEKEDKEKVKDAEFEEK